MSDCISRQAVLEMAYDMSEIDGEHFTEPCMVVDVEDIQKLPSVNPQEPCEIESGKLQQAYNKGFEDCRQAVLDTIGNVPDYNDGMVWEALSHAQRDVALLPSVNPQPMYEEREKGECPYYAG